jgi:hypothetical protein
MYKDLSPWGTGVITDELVDFEDLAPTLISLAGGKIPDYLKGRILMGKSRSETTNHLILSADRSDNGIDMVRSITDGKYMYSRNFMPYMSEVRYIRYMEISEIKQQMRSDLAADLLNPLQKSIFEDRPAEFLFDIENDVWEIRNLVSDPKYKMVLDKMRKELDDEVMRSRDVMFLPEYEIGLISKNGSPYEFRLDEKKYPLKEIYGAASLSGKRGKDIIEKQMQLMNSNNNVVRYWAMIGLRCQQPELLKDYQDEILKAMDDSYPPVAVTAAAISYQIFGSNRAEIKLKEFCKSDNMDVALMGVNYLLYVDNKQPFVETIREVREMPGRIYNVKAACMDFLGSLGLVPNNPDYRE